MKYWYKYKTLKAVRATSHCFIFLLFSTISLQLKAQKGQTSVSIRIPLQLEFQKAVAVYGPDETQKNTAINFGMDALLEYGVSRKLTLSAGLGYFRQRFNIRRMYDRQALNPTDSISYMSVTSNYDYHLLRVPLGIRYSLGQAAKSPALGIEYVPGFSVSNRYNGRKLFENTNQQLNKFRLFSHAFNLSARIPVVTNRSMSISVEPYARLLHAYKKDAILFEDEKQNIMRAFDAFGVAFTYQFRK